VDRRTNAIQAVTRAHCRSRLCAVRPILRRCARGAWRRSRRARCDCTGPAALEFVIHWDCRFTASKAREGCNSGYEADWLFLCTIGRLLDLKQIQDSADVRIGIRIPDQLQQFVWAETFHVLRRNA